MTNYPKELCKKSIYLKRKKIKGIEIKYCSIFRIINEKQTEGLLEHNL